MHDWSDDKVDWAGISDAARYMGEFMVKWGRLPVSDTKEKWGTARVYCYFGWYDLHSIIYPRHHYVQWSKGSFLDRLNKNSLVSRIIPKLGSLIIPYQEYIYYLAYKRAIEKWPHLRKEILGGADHSELLTKLGVRVVEDKEKGWSEVFIDEDDNGNT